MPPIAPRDEQEVAGREEDGKDGADHDRVLLRVGEAAARVEHDAERAHEDRGELERALNDVEKIEGEVVA